MLEGQPTSVELFAGAGGMALGIELAGFKSLATIEWNRWACDTMRENIRLGCPLVRDWNVLEMDARLFDWESIDAEVDLLAGGPPCQPFSIGGKGRANDDMRDMFPTMISAVNCLRPKTFIVENVKGLLRSQFSDYYQYILLRLEFPERLIKPYESWHDHYKRLQKAKTANCKSSSDLTYNVISTLVNAADYGIPQKRERVFIIGFRSDLGIQWSFPDRTHSKDALLYTQRKDGEYWERHLISPKKSFVDHAKTEWDGMLPWVTVRDVLSGMSKPSEKGDAVHMNHILKKGAKVYPGHTGSPLDMPSKTLKAGVHGVPGGENMLVRDNGKPRYYTVREAARIQTFPDGYALNGSWTETMRQLGNAVPVNLAKIIASSISEVLIGNEMARLCSKSVKVHEYARG